MNCNLKIGPYIVHNTPVFNFINKYILSFFSGEFISVMLFPFIVIMEPEDLEEYDTKYEIALNHEKIHFEQCKESFIFGFYFLMIYEYINNYVKLYDCNLAYKYIRFEREAYDNMKNLDYLTDRNRYNWQNYELFPGKLESNIKKTD